MSSAVICRLKKLPARVALAACLALIVSSCAYWEAHRILPFLGDSGAQAVSVVRDGDYIRYDLMSVLPGRREAGFCRSPTMAGSKRSRFVIVDCAANDTESRQQILHAFDQAELALRGYFSNVALAQVKIMLIPAGIQYIQRSRSRTRRNALAFSMAIRTVDRRDAYLRSAVRDFTHEFTHIAVNLQIEKQAQEEYVASVAESCIEYAVFGNTKGNVFKENLRISDGYNQQQQVSARSSIAAYRDILGFMVEGRSITREEHGAEFEAFCASTLRQFEG